MLTLIPRPALCTGCHLCQLGCSFNHHTLFSEALARLNVLADEATWNFRPVVCRQCEGAPCAAACPNEAITQDLETGALSLDESACSGCQACVAACPYEALVFNMDVDRPQLCNLCGGRPTCVADCPHAAIIYADPASADVEPLSPTNWFGEVILEA